MKLFCRFSFAAAWRNDYKKESRSYPKRNVRFYKNTAALRCCEKYYRTNSSSYSNMFLMRLKNPPSSLPATGVNDDDSFSFSTILRSSFDRSLGM
jgi:hypothetical protein